MLSFPDNNVNDRYVIVTGRQALTQAFTNRIFVLVTHIILYKFVSNVFSFISKVMSTEYVILRYLKKTSAINKNQPIFLIQRSVLEHNRINVNYFTTPKTTNYYCNQNIAGSIILFHCTRVTTRSLICDRTFISCSVCKQHVLV